MMRARSLLVLVATLITACGGASTATKKNAKSPNGSNGNDSIADEAAKNGGIAGLGPGVSTSAALAGSLQLQLLDSATPVKLDGVPQEWPARTSASQAIKGDGSNLGFSSA